LIGSVGNVGVNESRISQQQQEQIHKAKPDSISMAPHTTHSGVRHHAVAGWLDPVWVLCLVLCIVAVFHACLESTSQALA
jgi:hypothetical protein